MKLRRGNFFKKIIAFSLAILLAIGFIPVGIVGVFAGPGDTFFVKVVDSEANVLEGASVTLENTKNTDPVDVTVITDEFGIAEFELDYFSEEITTYEILLNGYVLGEGTLSNAGDDPPVILEDGEIYPITLVKAYEVSVTDSSDELNPLLGAKVTLTNTIESVPGTPISGFADSEGKVYFDPSDFLLGTTEYLVELDGYVTEYGDCETIEAAGTLPITLSEDTFTLKVTKDTAALRSAKVNLINSEAPFDVIPEVITDISGKVTFEYTQFIGDTYDYTISKKGITTKTGSLVVGTEITPEGEYTIDVNRATLSIPTASATAGGAEYIFGNWTAENVLITVTSDTNADDVEGYQWSLNGTSGWTDCEGATMNTLTISEIQSGTSYYFRTIGADGAANGDASGASSAYVVNMKNNITGLLAVQDSSTYSVFSKWYIFNPLKLFNARKTASIVETFPSGITEYPGLTTTIKYLILPVTNEWEPYEDSESLLADHSIGTWTTYSTPFVYPNPGLNKSVIYAFLSDELGNTKYISSDGYLFDESKSEISVSYDNNSVLNNNYYKAGRVATIKVSEENLDSTNDIVITGTASDNGVAKIFPNISQWIKVGNVYTTTISFNLDSKYDFSVNVTDKCGNKSNYEEKDFYIDTTVPTLAISGVANNSANKGDVVPVVTYSDTNFNKSDVSIKLSGSNNGALELKGTSVDVNNGQTFTFANFAKTKNMDDVYSLVATLTDFAGNTKTETITFSVNRFGSVYTFDDGIKNINGKYSKQELDVVITETNVDALTEKSLKMTKNGSPLDLVEGTDYTVTYTGGNGRWSNYIYTINKTLFKDDGKYTVTVYSVDKATNVNENIDETKGAEVSFGIDKTAPVIVPIDFESDKQYSVDEKSVSLSINDNLVLDSVIIKLDGKEVDYSVDGENYGFKVLGSNEKQSIEITALDAAGNQTIDTIDNILVTSNLFVRWYNNTVLFVTTISIAGVLIIGGAGLFIFSRVKEKA